MRLAGARPGRNSRHLPGRQSLATGLVRSTPRSYERSIDPYRWLFFMSHPSFSVTAAAGGEVPAASSRARSSATASAIGLRVDFKKSLSGAHFCCAAHAGITSLRSSATRQLLTSQDHW